MRIHCNLRCLTIAAGLALLPISGVIACSDSETSTSTTASTSTTSTSTSTSASSTGGEGGSGGQSGAGGQGGAGGAAPGCTLDKELLGQWSGEDNAKDSTKAADGVWTGTAMYVDGKLGKAFLFDGTNFVRSPVTYSGPMTVDLWVRATDASPQAFASAVSSGDAPTTTNFQMDADGVGNWRLSLGVAQGFGVIDNKAFQHLAFTHDGTMVRTYLEGKLVKTMAATGSDAPTFTTFKFGLNRSGDQPLKGAVDEVHVWKRALSDAEIAELHDKPKAVLCP